MATGSTLVVIRNSYASLNCYPRSVLTRPKIGELHLANGFGEALENLGIKLIAPIYLISARRSLDHNVIVTKIEAAKQDNTR